MLSKNDEIKEAKRLTFRDFINLSMENINKIEINIICIVRQLYNDGLDIDELQKKLDATAMFGDCFFRCVDNQLNHIRIIGEIASKLHDSIVDGSSLLEPSDVNEDGTIKSVPSLFNNTIHNLYDELISVREYLRPVLQAFNWNVSEDTYAGSNKVTDDNPYDAIHDFCDILTVEDEIIRILSAINDTIGPEESETCEITRIK